jgi:hypothetical protein
MNEKHRHQTILRGAAEELRRTGTIRTYDAVYRWVCPQCGQTHRTTRLADAVYALRHAYGWQITTHAEAGNLAVYTLDKAGDMPGEDNGPHPRRLVRVQKATMPESNVERIQREMATRPPQGYSAYDGQPVPVEAIPSGLIECVDCGWKPRPIRYENEPRLLGGYIRMECASCSTPGKPVVRMFRPVRVKA